MTKSQDRSHYSKASSPIKAGNQTSDEALTKLCKHLVRIKDEHVRKWESWYLSETEGKYETS